jgi:hypothetical protein
VLQVLTEVAIKGIGISADLYGTDSINSPDCRIDVDLVLPFEFSPHASELQGERFSRLHTYHTAAGLAGLPVPR